MEPDYDSRKIIKTLEQDQKSGYYLLLSLYDNIDWVLCYYIFKGEIYSALFIND